MTDPQHGSTDNEGSPGGPARQGGHRRFRWTYALGVSAAAFFVWLLLYAPTLQHNAQVSPVGARRTVSMDVLGPIAELSRVLQVSHVVSISDGALGRNGNHPGNGSGVVSLGPTGHPHVTTTTVPTTKSSSPAPTTTTTFVPSAATPLRVLVIGDSLGIDLGDALTNDLANTGVVTATLDGEVNTGLTRPDYYNWPAELQADLPKYNPQVVVVMVGANDPQDFPGPPDVPYGTAAWTTEYTQRVDAFMQEAASTGAKVVWVGMPPMQDPGRSAAMATLDGIYQTEAAKYGVTYVSSTAVVGTPQGGYTAYVDANGQEVNVRTPDGTHLAPGGAELLSQAVIATLRSQLHLAIPQ